LADVHDSAVHACRRGPEQMTIQCSPNPYEMVHEGQCTLGGKAWSWRGARRFGRGQQASEILDVRCVHFAKSR
jgi:hypothetical protein